MSAPSRNTMARNPSHFGSYSQPSPRGRCSWSFASIGGIGGFTGRVTQHMMHERGAEQASRGYGARAMAVTAKQIEELVTDGDDPVEAAHTAGLRHVSDRRPGISRKRAGKGFTYAGPDGKTIRDDAELARIRS